MEEYPQVYEKQVTLREYILKAKDYTGEVFRYWYVPAVFALLMVAWQLYKYSIYVPVYPATITFSVDEEESGGSALTGMLSQFGLGNVRPARYNFDKIMELSRSRRVVQGSLFSRITIDDQNDFIANHILRIYELNDPEADEPAFYFTHDSLEIFSRRENEVLKGLYHFVIGPPDQPEKALVSADYDEDTNIMSLTASTKNETLSLELSRLMFQALSDYYINKAIEKSKQTLEIVQTKRDSVLGELRSAEYQLANFKDRNKALMLRTDVLTEIRLQREVAALSAMYAEVIKNVEVADFSLRNKTPFIQVIDTPIPPIEPTALSLVRKIAIGLILGGLIGAALIIARKAYVEIMAEDPDVSVT